MAPSSNRSSNGAGRFSDIDVSFKRLAPVYGYKTFPLVSIEEALAPLESQIAELPEMVKIAKVHCLFPSEHGMTRDQSAAVYIYSMEWSETSLYRVLNKALRSENRNDLKIWFKYLKLFDSALELLPSMSITLWRGISADVGASFKKNQIITWWSYNSCTSSVKVIENFLGSNSGSTLFLIEAINGKDISAYTQYPAEDEVMLPMGSTFRVKSDSLKEKNGSCIVHLTEINGDEVGLAASSSRHEKRTLTTSGRYASSKSLPNFSSI